ncbi:5930_t:CDS:2 [Ambispora gerdemannii]|uniref:5930_t:CDS:1 n=1 Tax=Ambispora gerdemannii TaxID=144530 RepID=A0A9N8YKR4_9GLOM|nr:5930_t:CDS:2 [Ambispora gerdemannii]
MKYPNSFSLLTANRCGLIRTLGKRFYVRYWGKEYYYLDIQFFDEKDIRTNAVRPHPKKNLKPRVRQQNRLKSIAHQVQADGLSEIIGEQSRRQMIEEEILLEKIANSLPELKKKKYQELMRKRGIKSGSEKLAEETTRLERKLAAGVINEEEYQEKLADLQKRKDAYEAAKEKNQRKGKKTEPENKKKSKEEFIPWEKEEIEENEAKTLEKKDLKVLEEPKLTEKDKKLLNKSMIQRYKMIEFAENDVNSAIIVGDIGRGKTLLMSIIARGIKHGVKKTGFVNNIRDAE